MKSSLLLARLCDLCHYFWKAAHPNHFPKIFIKKQTQWSNDKTIIELGYRKILWFVSVSQINYLPQPLASANNKKIIIIIKLLRSPLTNHNILLNLVQ